MKNSRIFSILISLLMIVYVLSGCSNSSKNTASNTNSDNSEKPYEFEWMFQSIREAPPENDPIKQIIEKDTNTKFKIIVPPSNEYAEKVQVAVASGKYPDMIQFMGGMNWKVLAEQGAFVPVDDYIKDAPNLQKIVPKGNWDLLKMDGKIWGVPLLNVRTPVQLHARLDWIEELGFGSDWADNIGSEQSKTTDDFYKLLKAFKDKKKAVFTCSGLGGLAPLFGAFGVMPSNDFYIKDGSSVVRVTQHPNMKEALTWVNKLYKEGLIDPEFITNKQEQLDNKAIQNAAGMIYDIWNVSYRLEVQKKLKDVNPNAKWGRINPPQGPQGSSYMCGNSKVMDGVFLISSRTKNPKKLVQFLNYLLDGKGYEVSQYGIEGQHFVRKDGKIQFTDAGKAEWLSTYGKQRHTWDKEYWYAKYDKYAENLEDSATENKVLDNLAEAFTPGPVWKQYGADLNRYEQEMMLKFITGEAPISKWDEYVNICNTTYHAAEISKEIIDGLKKDGRL